MNPASMIIILPSPAKLDPESAAYKRRSNLPSFDPNTRSVLAVLKDQEVNRNFCTELGPDSGRKI